MSDEPFDGPNRLPAPPRQPKPGELLFEFIRGSDGQRMRCELCDLGKWGIEAQFFDEGGPSHSRRFDLGLGPVRSSRELAIAWAEEERKAFEKFTGHVKP